MSFIGFSENCIYIKEVDTPFEINENLLALNRKGNKSFVLWFDLKRFDRSFKSLLDGLLI